MKLTAFTDYSLRVLMYLAAEPGRRATIAEIAAAFEIKENHLTKVAHFLGKHGWLANVRGKGGGLELARAPRDIVIGTVVRATEGEAMPAECFGDEAERCCLHRICRLRSAFRRAVEAFYAVLDGCTLEDVTANRPSLARVLFVERPPSRAATPSAR